MWARCSSCELLCPGNRGTSAWWEPGRSNAFRLPRKRAAKMRLTKTNPAEGGMNVMEPAHHTAMLYLACAVSFDGFHGHQQPVWAPTRRERAITAHGAGKTTMMDIITQTRRTKAWLFDGTLTCPDGRDQHRRARNRRKLQSRRVRSQTVHDNCARAQRDHSGKAHCLARQRMIERRQVLGPSADRARHRLAGSCRMDRNTGWRSVCCWRRPKVAGRRPVEGRNDVETI